MKKNLLSMSQLTDIGNYVLFGPKDVKFYKEKQVNGPPYPWKENDLNLYLS